jgi:multidrug efflux system membrane fusion protein
MTPLFKRRLIWPTPALLLALIAIAWSISLRAVAVAPAVATPPAVPVTTVAVQQQDVPVYLAGIGAVTPNATVTVKARVDGQLDSVDFIEGQDVAAGQLLAQIDPRTLEAQLQQAQAQKAKDQAQLTNARLDLQRFTSLHRDDAATQQSVDTQRAMVAQLDAAIKNDDASISFAKVQLGFTRITAPLSGRLGARLVDAGNIVHASDATGLVVINQIDPISVLFTLPEASVQAINQAVHDQSQPLAVHAFRRDSDKVVGTGKLTLVNNQVDTNTGTVQLKGTFPNAAHALWPGQYVNIRLVLGQRKGTFTVPAAAVQRSQSGTYAYVVDGDSIARSQPITVAQIQDGIAVIEQGLAAGQRVVVDGQYKLKPGIKVAEASAPPKVDAGGNAVKGRSN